MQTIPFRTPPQTQDKTRTSQTPTDYDYVHELLLQIAAATNAPFREPAQAVYLKMLGHLDKNTADEMQERVLAEWDKPNMMPPIAFLLARATRVPLQAEQQWDRVLNNFAHYWHPDIGLCADAPKLDRAAEYALRQIGGYCGFGASKFEHEGLMRDRFMEAYGRFHVEGGEQTHFTQELSERVLKQLRGEEPIQLRGED
jgi:hypothetical protein